MENLLAVLLLISVFLFIIGLFSPKTSLFWYKNERTRTRSSLIYGLSAIIFFALFGITAPDVATTQAENSKLKKELVAEEETVSPAPTKYVTVLTIKGNGTKNSASFHLNGNDAKLIYKYNTDGNIGVFGIYILNKGDDIMKTGGIPEVTANKTRVSDESSLQKAAGDYYLHVNAYGEWKVTVEEME